MAKKQEPIRVEAFIKVGDEDVNIDSLPLETKKHVRQQLALIWYNAMWSGKAVFRIKEGA